MEKVEVEGIGKFKSCQMEHIHTCVVLSDTRLRVY